ncbi:MAG: aspartate carbamoyltransferase, partial [Candidatus Diapherotrites archaeon]|nr:aspartate carbamoyltransferase [Candidatus Diapherotrites archaeon]
CSGKILGSAFFEPSTRTMLSFHSAMQRLGGSVLGFSDPSVTSVKKGECLADTMRTLEAYCDLMVIRHPNEGSAKPSSEFVSIPVINAGDGGREHPIQTLLDVFTIKEKKGSLKGLNVVLCGDLKYGRTVHSLAKALAGLGVNISCVSPSELKMPESTTTSIQRKHGVSVVEETDLISAVKDADVLYMTRIQKERFGSPEEYAKVKDCYVVNKKVMSMANENMLLMHPLPRVNEITFDVDSDKRAIFFEQALNGVFVRMALISLVLGVRG